MGLGRRQLQLATLVPSSRPLGSVVKIKRAARKRFPQLAHRGTRDGAVAGLSAAFAAAPGGGSGAGDGL